MIAVLLTSYGVAAKEYASQPDVHVTIPTGNAHMSNCSGGIIKGLKEKGTASWPYAPGRERTTVCWTAFTTGRERGSATSGRLDRDRLRLQGRRLRRRVSRRGRTLDGYKVIFLPLHGGKPSDTPQNVLDFDDNAKGRPVGVAIDRQGPLLLQMTSATRCAVLPYP
jgi:hypothetical protein